MKKKDRLTLTCEDYTHEGLGVCHHDGATVFVKNMIAGEMAEVEIIKVLKNYNVGRVLEFKVTSEHRVTPACPHFKTCGGCQLMHMDSVAQQDFKTRRVKDTLRKIGHLDLDVKDCLMDSDGLHYRNKVQVPTGYGNGHVISGFYRARTNDIVDNDTCLIQNDFSNKVTAYVKSLMDKYHIMPYDKQKHRGCVKHILTRYGRMSGEGLLAMITYTPDLPHKKQFLNDILHAFPQITTIIQNINPRHDNVILGDEVKVLYGPGYITDELLGNTYKISLKSFYQINPAQTERLYETAIDMASLTKDDVVLDAYCGIGTIGMSLARRVKHVYGVEVVADAIKDAKENAQRNHIDNVTYVCADAGDYMVECAKNHQDINVVMVDPPRKGCSETFLQSLVTLMPERVVYISCNVATQARDLDYLRAYYTVEDVQPVDLFPLTRHVETVCLLSKLHGDKHIEVEVTMDEMDLTSAESKATYEEIKAYVLEKFGLHVSHLYIAQVKRKCGIIERANYNLPKSENSRQPQCPPEKEAAIRVALEHFQMI